MCNSFGFGGNDSSLILSKNKPELKDKPSSEGARIRIAAQRVVKTKDELLELKEYLSPMDTRRMGTIMKASLLSAFAVLKEAGLQRPDAIIAATSKGMLELSTMFLEDIADNHEEHLKPTLFMQSTHNTIASAIAIRTGCHGYNITYSQGDDSYSWALRDAELLLKKGLATNVLICAFDEELLDGRTDVFMADSKLFTID